MRMPDSNAQSRTAEPAGAQNEQRNLPVPVARPIENAGEGFFARIARAFLGWKSGPTRADIEVVLEAAVPGETGVSPEERTMLKNILALRGRRVDDVMVPRADIVAVQQDISLGELIKVFESAGHSRLVVYNDTLDDPDRHGAHPRPDRLHDRARSGRRRRERQAQEAAAGRARPQGRSTSSMPLSATKIVREMLFVPPSMPAIDLLAKMQATRIHLALVVDEYGGTDGLVSIEDIVEQIVGDIADEHDEDDPPPIVRQSDGSFLADARASLEDVCATVGRNSTSATRPRKSTRSAAISMTRVGRAAAARRGGAGPGGFEIEVLDADPRRVKRVRITAARTGRDASRDAAPARRCADGVAPPAARPCASVDQRRRRPATPSRTQRATSTRTPADVHASSHAYRARLGLAPRADRFHGRRRVGAGACAGQCLAGAVRHVSSAGLADRRRGRRPARRHDDARRIAGWWFGFGYFVAGLYWIGHAFLVDAKTFGWLLPFAVLGLPACLAILHGVGLALARLLWVRGAVAHSRARGRAHSAEWLRGHVLTGFPWNTFGYALTGPLVLAQGAALIGSGA